ncbi:bifunctional 4-hydroxy-2-oxoglutarate aldolase/2-dehydro-3-deoxy-phosphogluconate aldolase [Streptomyces ficellus]|uniref:Bifunctional 4-hydroxy-2-oxoglutarate aldolase/2-dehydro-3-deoxy-phosphogluconate aldolase n=1 Tax=Streptomyces ficellus TaxID=1977088 RepID=A0A6I6FHR5_9ACTN|nr:bifunctional 4-hydroxy-2-oxoglutarate aldolase/2-dehydro-3-deoxy-phosphogluconate aldolase [Streptomyces ficellus]QGV77018.1 bifunctional 4-hydroxy-2-oxoglutarate aldolase/2-dehydro-3-deoxy-phosphogluconate aldolase [Streptomyces ficellus]
MTDLTTALADTPVIAILRSGSARHLTTTADTLHQAGLRAVEFTLTTPGALDALHEYAGSKPSGMALGAGTVITPSQAHRAVEAGATYLITPATCLDVVVEARRLGVLALPGAFTPSEILSVRRAGASMVKLFPASVGGPDYLRAVLAPLPDVRLVPTGGISIEQAPAYLAAGAAALGMGSPLVGDACEGGDEDALRERAAALLNGIRA